MNDLHFIFYEAKRMYLDTSDMSGPTERAHRRLCDFIWFNGGPPLNDNESLRQITHTEADKWGKVKRELMLKGWVDGPTFFLHRGAIKSLNESREKFVENHNRTAAANQKPRMELLLPDPETGVANYHSVTNGVTSRVTAGQSESEPQGQGKTPPALIKSSGEGCGETVAPEPHLPEIPTVEQAVAQTMTAGIPEDFTRYVYQDWSVRAGRDAGGVVVPWLPYVTKRWARERVEWQNGKHRGKNESKTNVRTNPRNVGIAETDASKTDITAVLARRNQT